MSISYQDAMQQLQAMFPDFDRETLKTLLVANEGHFEKTIEDCLKMANDNEEHGGNDGNLFSNVGQKKSNQRPSNQYNASDGLFDDNQQPPVENAFENLGIFQNNNNQNNKSEEEDEDDFGDKEFKSQQIAKKLQENEDAKLAYALQQEYIRREQVQEASTQNNARNQQQNYNQGNLYPGQRAVPNEEGKYNGNYNSGMNNMNNVMQVNPTSTEKKKKKGFGSKIKSAFSSLFKKGKKKNAPTNNPGEYAEIGNDDGVRNEQREHLQFDQLDADEDEEQEQEDHDRPIQLSDILGGGGNQRNFGEDKPQQLYPNLENDEDNQHRPNSNQRYNYS